MKFHKNAKTNIHVRTLFSTSTLDTAQLSVLYGVHPKTVRKWKHRADKPDRSHTRKNIKYALSDLETSLFVTYRRVSWEGLDECIDHMEQRLSKRYNRATIHNLFKRHNLNRKPKQPKEVGKFEPCYKAGFLHIDCTELPNPSNPKRRFYLFVAIDRATRYMYFRTYDRQTAHNARDFFMRCLSFFPFKIYKVITDNGREFTNAHLRPRGKTGIKIKLSIFSELLKNNGIKHTLTKPYKPQTNGMVERVNGKIKEATIHVKRYASGFELLQDLEKFLHEYNHHRRHGGLVRELQVRTPVEAIKKICA